MPNQVVTTGTYCSDADLAFFDDKYTAFELTKRDACRTRAYDVVNSVLRTKVVAPIRQNSQKDYDGFVKDMQALLTLSYLYAGKAEEKSTGFWQRVFNTDKETGVADQFRNGYLLLEEQITTSTIGVQPTRPDSGNTGSGSCDVDDTREYTGLIRKVFTVTIDLAGTIGTATFKWRSNVDTSWQETGVTTDDDFNYLTDNVAIYFTGNESNAFALNDSWTIDCVPMTTGVSSGPSSGGLRVMM